MPGATSDHGGHNIVKVFLVRELWHNICSAIVPYSLTFTRSTDIYRDNRIYLVLPPPPLSLDPLDDALQDVDETAVYCAKVEMIVMAR